MAASTAPPSEYRPHNESPLAGFYRPVEGAFLFSGAFAFTWRCGAFCGLGVRLPSHDAKGVLQLAYGGERGACAWPLRFPFKNPMCPVLEQTQ